LSRISPALSSLLAERLFRTPPPFACTDAEKAVLSRGLPGVVTDGSGPLATWTWGEGPVVLLVHGWGGHAGRLTGYVEPLIGAGFRAVAFDLPGHGASASGPVSLPEMADAILRVTEKVGPIAGVIAHSVGATASALAMRRGFAVSRAVFLSPSADFEGLSLRFSRLLRLPEAVRESMRERLRVRYAAHWSHFRIVDWARSLSTSLLVFHDTRDFTVPLSDGQAIAGAWRKSRLVATRGLGHHKILRARLVIRQAVAFLAAGKRSAVKRRILAGRASAGPSTKLLGSPA